MNRSKVTTQGSTNNTNSSSAVLPIIRKDKKADAVGADPSKFEMLALPLCKKKLTFDQYSLAARADGKTAHVEHVAIEMGEFQRNGIGVLTLRNHAAGTI